MYEQNLNSAHSTSKPLLLEAKGVSHKFDYELFNDINLSLHQKETIAIIGMSGSGKSTLLNILSSLLKPNSGEVFFEQKDIYKQKKSKLLNIRREDFGIIFQAHYLFRGFSAKENLDIATLLSLNEIDTDLLKVLDIEYVLNQGVGELSGGQQQRLSIARVLTKKPKVIFADEPTGNLDKETSTHVIDALFEYVNSYNAGLILVTHDEELAKMCDKTYKLIDLKLEEIG
ncbi:ABC transporter ATP-binding protein [Malaciobacter marinus]|uniref:ABC transporter ATP-binding protein n=1 Tax=Malaciobacter marinus TaxID=505249 RepID=UPI0009D39CFF|nr:ABC transporter ATP-binding protein [Malaciobacter marinus]SKB30125.1 putative ABC transport system ATP-binding protein [Malaciobacter marinus]